MSNDLLQLLLLFPDKKWNWWILSENPNITWEIIESNPDKEWNWFYISCNPNITYEIIKSNPTKPWSWRRISENKFLKDKRSRRYLELILGIKGVVRKCMDNKMIKELLDIIEEYIDDF